MKYYWIASTIEIKTTVLPCCEINTKNYVIFADFKSFQAIFVDFLSHFYRFLGNFIDHYFQVIKIRAPIITNKSICKILTDFCYCCNDLKNLQCSVTHIPIDIMQAFLQDGTKLVNTRTFQCVHEQGKVWWHKVLNSNLHQLQALHTQLKENRKLIYISKR